MRLSDSQKKAVYHREGPCLVLAGPGSGKTTVITRRLGFLTDGITSPDRLLSVTFTRAAGREMAVRYASLYPDRRLPHFGTVHSLCNRIIYDYENITGKKYFRIGGDTKVKQKILEEIWSKVNKGVNMPEAEEVFSLISRRTNRPEYSSDGFIRNFEKIYEMYITYKRQNSLVDFDDMVLYAKELLENDERILRRWSKKYEYIQVDEGQDLSRAQFEVMKYLAGHGNIFVVADDDQGIYAFRGADPGCVLEFEKYYSNCVKYYLEENYRSCKRIVQCASSLIALNGNRYEKNLYTNNRLGEKIEFAHLKNLSEQARFVCEKISKLSKKGSVCVIYRNNLSACLFKLYLNHFNLSYNVLGGNINIASDMMVKKVLKNIRNAEKEARFIIPRPKKVFERMILSGFYDDMSEYYERNGKSRVYSEYVYEFLKTLCSINGSYEDITRCIEFKEDKQSNITLSTAHSAKGLEFDTVFIVDLVNGEFPKRESLGGDMLEEEGRLFYVAMTRARSKLFLVYPEMRGNNQEEASVFYEETLRHACNQIG
ncbi:MAG: ATP-dependent helicase [Clostridiaceae bacterium]|nr:ATP-dependent helicase [Clostridiaceae bacterium]